MTKLLLRLFVRGYEQPEAPEVRSRVGRLSGVVGILCNLVLFAGKLLVGTLAGSVAITADAMNNLSDATSSIVTLVGFKLAERPADADHPYGHARFEYLSGLAVAAMIVVIGFELGKTSFSKILAPEAVEFSIPVAVVLVGSIGVKLWLSVFNGYLGGYIRSGTLKATAADSRNDVVSTAVVLAAALIQWGTGWMLDGWMGLAVALFILYSGAMLAKDTISPLLGEAASPELKEQIVHIMDGEPWVLGYHDLMVHDYGPGQRFASLHVEMDQKRDPLQCHERIDDLERQCLQELGVHLVIHYDPVVTDDPVVEETRQQVLDILLALDERFTIHDFRMVSGDGHTNVIFDLAMPPQCQGQQKQIREELERELSRRKGSSYYAVITFDLEQFN